MKPLKRAALVTAALLSVSGLAFGQGGRMRQGGGNYNPATEVTVKGTVDEVKHMPAPANGPGGLHLMVRTEAGVLEVDLGPASFISGKHFEFAKGDALTVTGSRMKRAEQDVIIAREITKGDNVLTLRDAKGFPLWSGRGGRQP
jgi:hypothetical protein